MSFFRYLPDASGEGASRCPLPEGKATPFGWPAWRIDSHGIVLRWRGTLQPVEELRFTVALDLREAPVVEVLLGECRYRVGLCEVIYGYPLQTFPVNLPEGLEHAILKEGLLLRTMSPDTEVWILAPAECGKDVPEMLAPHLFGPSGTKRDWENAYASLCSPASLQIFGWLEGCVLEGLNELALRREDWRERAEAAIQLHLDHFFSEKHFSYVTPRSEPTVDNWRNNEHGLMLPSLIRYRPEHPAVSAYESLLYGHYRKQLVTLEQNVSCEGCYTVAYPFAMLARLKQNPDFLDLALDLLLLHQRALKVGETLFLQYRHEERKHVYPFWIRGVAWYLLGHARVLQIVAEWPQGSALNSAKVEAVRSELQGMIQKVASLQRNDFLWNCFAEDAASGAETSGAAGVAAAFLLAGDLGCAPDSMVESAKQTLRALESYLTSDGLLGGVVQSNKIEAGEPLQRYGARCRSQMGQGLAVQLSALLVRRA